MQKKILIVDDEEMIRQLFCTILAPLGTCIVAANPTEALGFFASQHFDVVVTDRSMPNPEMGEKLVLDILAMNPIPIIMVTGDDITSPPDGVSLLLHKPVGVDKLIGAVKEALTVILVANLHATDAPKDASEEVVSPLNYGGGHVDATMLAEGQPHHTVQIPTKGKVNLFGYHATLDHSTLAVDPHAREIARNALCHVAPVESTPAKTLQQEMEEDEDRRRSAPLHWQR